jgi:outer membrane immunogenic protein
MRRFSLTVLAAVGISAAGMHSGFAADLGVPLKSPPSPAWSWTGFYIGVNGGAGTGTTDTNINAGALLAGLAPGFGLTIPLPSQTYTGFLGGVQAGYNWQTGPFVLGVEGDFDGATFQGNTACILVFNCTVKHDWVADVTARLGVVTFDRALVYVKGGAAWTDGRYSFGNSVTVPAGFGIPAGTYALNASGRDTPIGGLLGFGVEYAFLPNWSAKVEYNYIDFGTSGVGLPLTTTPAVAGLPTISTQIKDTMQIVKGGVSYHF